MAAELPQPGVEVVQEFRTVSPSVITPTLVPCPVGVAKEVLEVLVSDGSGGNSLNADTLIALPAFFISKDGVGSPAVYANLDGEILEIIANNGTPIQLVFSDPSASGLTPATVVSQINDQLTAAQVTSFVAETVGDDTWQLRTVGVGDTQTLKIGSNTDAVNVAPAFGIGIGHTYTGLGNYNQYIVEVPPEAFPDPRGNLSELAIENDTIRVFLAVAGAGTTLVELLRDEAFLRNGEVNDAATTTEGTTALSALTMASETLTLFLNGSATATSIVFGTESGEVAILAILNATLNPLGFTASAGTGTPGGVVITSDNPGPNYSIQVDATGGGQTKLTMTVETVTGYRIVAVDDGNGDALTNLLDFNLYDFGAAQTQAVMLATGATYPLPAAAGGTIILSDGQQPQTVEVADGDTLAQVITKLEAVFLAAAGGKLTFADVGGQLEITHDEYGADSYIEYVGGTALVGLTAGTVVSVDSPDANGDPVPHPPVAGDYLYIDGEYFATITEVEPGTVTGRLKINRYVAISTDVGQRFWIQAKNLVSPYTNRPYPDLTVDLNGNVALKHSVLRDTTGARTAVTAPLYLIYTAVRQDVSSEAANPGLLRFDDTATLESSMDPISADNPLALGLFFALLNAPGAQVTGLGVDEISSDMPYGTLEGFTRAAEFLEGFEVYALAPLTHDKTVAEVFNTHVTFMSEPEMKGERIVLWNPSVPDRQLDDLVASGTDGDAISTTIFDTKVAQLAALVQNAGITPIGTIPVTDGLYLDIASDDARYSIKSINGAQITIRTVAGDFAAGENDDSFYSESAPTLPLISETFSIKVRGAELLTPTGQADKTAIAETMQALGQSFLNRRFWMTFPDQCAATLGGVEQILEGFYMNAAIAGMIAQQPPQQSFTNFPMAGFTRVIGSNDTFNRSQLNVMAAGGTYIIIQEATAAPLISRMALTTNMTSVETRTDSITKVVDFTAKFLRRSLQSFIGRFNITQGFLDSLGSVIQGVLGFLVESGVLIGGTLNNIIQDEDQPDTVLVDITLDVPYPCNYIRLTLVV